MTKDRPKFFNNCPICNTHTPPGTVNCPGCGVDLEIARQNMLKDLALAAGTYGYSMALQDNQPKLLSDFWYVVIGFITNILISLFIAGVMYGSFDFGVFLYLAYTFFLTYISTLGRYGKVNFYGFVNLVVWSAVPIVNWAVVYYFGKGLYFSYTKQKVTNPPVATSFWTIVLSVGLFIAFIVYLIDISNTPSAPTPTKTPIRFDDSWKATQTAKAPPAQQNNCTHWSQITPQMEGQQVCVYGTVTSHRENWESFLTNLYFAGDFGTPAFFLVSTDRFTPLEGQCISTTGTIQLNTYKTPYIKIEEFYYCDAPIPAYTSPLDNNDYSGCPAGCTTPPTGCNIKGNISYDTGEKIYHLPGQEFYSATTINPAYGERWFCTEEEARANGWRKSQQ